jgi:hypothetical protein
MTDQAEEHSPDGRLLVRWDIDHGRMSHEICTPTIVDLTSSETLLQIRQHGVDGHPQWRPGGFDLALRNYYYPTLALKMRVDLGSASFRLGDDGPAEPLARLSARVDQELRCQMRAAQAAARRQWRAQVARDWGVIVLGIAAFAAAALYLR